MAFNSTKQSVTGFFDPNAKRGLGVMAGAARKAARTAIGAAILAAKGAKAVASDPMGLKRDKKRSQMFDRIEAETNRKKAASMRSDYMNVK